MLKYFTLLVLLFAFLGEAAAKVRFGEATAYSDAFQIDKTGKNACQFNARKLDKKWQTYYAAINEFEWNRLGKNKVCNLCLKARGLKGHTTRGHKRRTVLVKIVDQCPGWACTKTAVDFSAPALKAITGFSWDRKNIRWEYADCKTGRPTWVKGRRLLEESVQITPFQ